MTSSRQAPPCVMLTHEVSMPTTNGATTLNQRRVPLGACLLVLRHEGNSTGTNPLTMASVHRRTELRTSGCRTA